MTTPLLWQGIASLAHDTVEDTGAIPDRCILMTRLFVEVGKRRPHLGTVRPVVASALAANAVWWDHLDSGGGKVTDPISTFPPKAWSVAVDRSQPNEPGRYAGHLVAVVDGRILVDGSAGQMSRPHRQIPIPPTLVVPFDAWDEQHPVTVRDDESGATVIYFVPPAEQRHGYQHAPDWRPPRPALIRPLLSRVDSLVAALALQETP